MANVTRRKSKSRRNQRGGKAGRMKRILNFSNSPIIGAGGYGIIVHHTPKRVFKLLKDPSACKDLQKEVTLQQKASTLLAQILPEVYIPPITYITNEVVSFQKIPYLCGIEMEYLPPPNGFTEQVHMLLGYTGDDIDTEWGMRTSEPVSSTNPTRGFFASPETLEDIWKEEGSSMTIEYLSYLMGRANRLLLDNGILPIDLEWVWSNGRPTLIDFGLAEEGQEDLEKFLLKKGVRGLADDFYIPTKGFRGYDEFLKGFYW